MSSARVPAGTSRMSSGMTGRPAASSPHRTQSGARWRGEVSPTRCGVGLGVGVEKRSSDRFRHARFTRTRYVLAALLVATSSVCATAKPRVPPGTDPGGLAIAIIGSGLDYTRPEIASRLARDGEGEPIAWDFHDMDRSPYEPAAAGAASAPGTATAKALLAERPDARIVPLRVKGDGKSLAGAAYFASKSPARMVLVTVASTDRQDWQAFAEIASRRTDLLFVIAAGDEGIDLDSAPRYPASLGLPNIIVVSACDGAGKPLPGANTGAKSVDVLIPVEPTGTAVSHDGKLVAATSTALAAARVISLTGDNSTTALPGAAKIKEALRHTPGAPPTPESLAASRLGCIKPLRRFSPATKF